MSLAAATVLTTLVVGAHAAVTPTASPATMADGKRLYRKYCGQCHALRVALAAGFGSNNGLGTDGGPSFDRLRVPFRLSVLAIKQPFIGHEKLVHRMTWTQIRQVSTYVAVVTRNHPTPAQNIDG